MSPSLATERPRAPVSSSISRRAAASAVSPASTIPFGSAHSVSGRPRGLIAAKTQSPFNRRISTPPDENSRRMISVCPTQPACTHPTGPAMVPAGTQAPRVPDISTRSLWRFGMNLQPLGDRLIVEVLEQEETTVAGIVLPDTAQEKPQRGTVLAVGPGALNDKGERVALDLAEGDVVVFSKYGGTEIKVEADEYLILRESDVLAKVVGDRQPAGAKA